MSFTSNVADDIRAEIAKLESVLEILEGGTKQRKGKKKSKFSAEARAEMSRKMKKAWKKRKAEKAKAAPAAA
jgi:hypothetical protein